MSSPLSITEQLGAARRELALRQRCYPKWIPTGKITQAKADHEIACMEAIVGTLQKLKDLEEVSDELKLGDSRPPRKD